MPDQNPPSMAPGYAVTGCGCLLAMLSLAVALFFAFHVFIDRRGAISGREAEPAFAGGLCCALGSLLIVAVGGAIIYMAKQKAKAIQAEQSEQSEEDAPQ